MSLAWRWPGSLGVMLAIACLTVWCLGWRWLAVATRPHAAAAAGVAVSGANAINGMSPCSHPTTATDRHSSSAIDHHPAAAAHIAVYHTAHVILVEIAVHVRFVGGDVPCKLRSLIRKASSSSRLATINQRPKRAQNEWTTESRDHLRHSSPPTKTRRQYNK